MSAPAPFRLQLMGGFRLSCGDSVVRASADCRRVLAALAVRGTSSRHALAVTLWPECPDARAYGNLRTALWRAARLGPGLVNAQGRSVALHDTVEVDVHEFEAWGVRVLDGNGLDGHLHGDPVAPRHPGDLLPEWFDDWVVIERERLRQLRLQALEASARRLADAGRHGGAARVALEAVRLDPLRDSAQELVITSYLAEDNVGAAARQLMSFRELLRVELGIEPAPRLVRLVADRLAERSAR